MQRTSAQARDLLVKGALAISIMSGSVFAQTAAERISRFGTLLGTGKYAYLTWQKRSGDGKPEPYYEGQPNSLMFVDTKVGEVKTYRDKGGFFVEPSFTSDGERIIYYNMAAKDIRIMSRDGTGDKSFATGYAMLGDTWRSSDGKQWVIASKITGGKTTGDCDYTTQISIERIEITSSNAPGEKVVLATNAGGRWSSEDCRTLDWGSLSPDGKYLTGGFPMWGNLGIYNTQTNTLTKLTINGCWISMAQDGTNHIMYTDNPQGHKGVYIIDVNQKEVLKQSVTAALPAGGSFDALRWTPNRDYCTYSAQSGGSFLVPNPRLVRISDQKYASVNDNSTGAEGSMDAFFYGPNTVITQSANPLARTSARGQGKAYDLRGRCVPRQAGESRGVRFLTTSVGTAGSASIVIRAH